jgi:hypothetical protein
MATIMETSLHTFDSLGSLEAPDPFYDFVQTSASILERAHTGSLLVADTAFKIEQSDGMHRAYFKRVEQENLRNYEQLSLHLGRSALMVCMDHRHEEALLSRLSIVIEKGVARAHTSHPTAAQLHTEVITGNEDAARLVTERLNHSMEMIGMRALLPDVYSQAS